jgi:hypothetical protein
MIASELAHELYERGYESWKRDFPAHMLLAYLANIFSEYWHELRLHNGCGLTDEVHACMFFEELSEAMAKRRAA